VERGPPFAAQSKNSEKEEERKTVALKSEDLPHASSAPTADNTRRHEFDQKISRGERGGGTYEGGRNITG